MSADRGERFRRTLRFVLDGQTVELDEVDPTRTVLRFLREDLHRTGTKEGCAEGDCGACTVVVADLDESGQRLRARAVNACIQFLPTLDGKELLTVESLATDALHPAQQAMVECHGSQCGFCTPGFVMSLFALYKNAVKPGRRDIDHALAGNLCRCTGYQPIVAAAGRMYELDATGDSWTTLAADGGLNADEQDRAARLAALRDARTLCIEHDARRYFAPRSVEALAGLLAEFPQAVLLAGGTDVGLWVTKQHRDLEIIIHTGAVDELCEMRVTDAHLDIGAAAPLTDVMPALSEHFPELDELFLRFASPPIRNAATLGGNIANGSPIGDAMPALIVLGAELVLRKGDGSRTLPLEDFYIAYRQTALQPGEFVERIRIPLRRGDEKIASYKLCKRFDQDISAVCGAYCLRFDGQAISAARIAYGGMAEIPKRADGAEAALIGSSWDEAALSAACDALGADYTPITDMRASSGYRVLACANLLRRFWLECRGEQTDTVYGYGR